MRVARVVARHAVLLLFVVLAIAPATALAFTPPDPNNPGNHYGEYLHNPHLQQQAPTPGGGGGGNGIQNSFGSLGLSTAVQPSAESTPAFQFQPRGLAFPELTSALSLGRDAWWVAIILAAIVATNVALGVLWLARATNFLLQRSKRLVLATA